MANSKKPRTIEEYKAWLRAEHQVDNLDRLPDHYDAVAREMRQGFEQLPLWIDMAGARLKVYEEQYQLAHAGYQLLVHSGLPELKTKSFESLFGKTFRLNSLQNDEWPNPPKWLGRRAWILPRHWYHQLNDIVRTCFVVKYFDGVEFLASKIKEDCGHARLKCHVSYQARDEGHYAAHVYVTYDCEVPTLDLDREIVRTTAELQITTQIQDVIRRMLHKHYERRREMPAANDEWKWDHHSAEFASHYLGHVLHYLDGMIVQARDK